MTSKYDQAVGARYHIYNSLFLNLPFQHILRTGTLLASAILRGRIRKRAIRDRDLK